MSKQDRQGARTPAALERKYDFKSFAQASGNATEASRHAHEANQAAYEANKNATDAAKAIAELTVRVDELSNRFDSVDAQSAYTAMMTDTLLTTLTKDKISAWYAKSLWTAAMVNKAVDKGVLTSDEAAEIIG